MYDRMTARAHDNATTTQICTAQDPLGREGNQAAMEQLSEVETEAEAGWLDLFEAEQGGSNDTPGFGGPDHDGWGAPDISSDRLLLGPDTASGAAHWVDEAETIGGNAQQRATGWASFGPDSATMGGRGQSTTFGPDGKPNSGFGFHGSASTNGVFQGGFNGKMGDHGAGAEAWVDLDEKGEVQEAGLSASVESGTTAFGLSGSIRPERVEVEAGVVTWSYGHGVGVSGKANGAGFSVSDTQARTETRTFPTASEAEAYAARLRRGKEAGFAGMDCDQLEALEPGTAITVDRTSKEAASATVLIGGSVTDASAAKVELVRGEGSAVTLKVTRQANDELGGQASNGAMAVEMAGAMLDDTELEYELDLSKAAHREAFERFQDTGELTGPEPVAGSAFDGVGYRRGMGVPGVRIDESWSEEQGTVIENGIEQDAFRGKNADGLWMPSASQLLDDAATWVKESGVANVPLQLASMWRLGEPGALDQRQESYIDRSGNRAGEVVISAPRDADEQARWMNMRMSQTETIAFTDRQEACRSLNDAVTPAYDVADIEQVRPLPPHARQDRSWTLESVIDEQGTFNVMQQLKNGGWMMEVAGLKAVDGAEDVFAKDPTPRGFMEAAANLYAQGGPDAAEGMRYAAGPEHVEQFLSLAGDPNWKNAEDNERLDQHVEWLVSAGSSLELSQAADVERRRRDAILAGDYLEVPPELRDAELERIERRLQRLGEGA